MSADIIYKGKKIFSRGESLNPPPPQKKNIQVELFDKTASRDLVYYLIRAVVLGYFLV